MRIPPRREGGYQCSGLRRLDLFRVPEDGGEKRLCEACFNASYVPGRGDQGEGTPLLVARGTARAAVPGSCGPRWPFCPCPSSSTALMTYMMPRRRDIGGAAQLLVSLLLYSSTLAFAFIAVSRYGNALAELGVHAGNLPSSLGLGFIGGSLAFWLAVASGLISRGMFGGLAEVEKWLQGFFDVNVKDVTGVDMFIAGIIIIVAAPICEELFFRGYLYPAMRGRLGLWGVFPTAFLFSVSTSASSGSSAGPWPSSSASLRIQRQPLVPHNRARPQQLRRILPPPGRHLELVNVRAPGERAKRIF